MVELMKSMTGLFLAMAFYSFMINGYIYLLPNSITSQNSVSDIFTSFSGNLETYNQMSSELSETVTQERDAPYIDLGAIIFHSGNIIIDFVVNFVTAVPQLIGFGVNFIFLIFPIDSYIKTVLTMLIEVISTFVWLSMVLGSIVEIRTGRSVS